MIHLRAHSCYSFLEALPTPGQLAQAGRDTGMQALALTDHLSLAGAVEFYLDCQQAGVRPILGLEGDLELPSQPVAAGRGPLALLATDLPGWRSLCGLVSALLGDPQGNPAGSPDRTATSSGPCDSPPVISSSATIVLRSRPLPASQGSRSPSTRA